MFEIDLIFKRAEKNIVYNYCKILKERKIIMLGKNNEIFSLRETPWQGLGKKITEATSSKEALEIAGLNWNVIQEPVITASGDMIEGYKANIRDIDGKVLGVVTNRYKIIQNHEAFSFTDELLGEGVRFESAGVLQDGKKVWVLARLPQEYIISGERISPYLLFFNSHDGSSAVRICVTPIRFSCSNTLNLALASSKRSWSANHTGEIKGKLEEARNTLFMAESYMDNLGKEFEALRRKKLSDQMVKEYIEILLPIDANGTPHQIKNIERLREDMRSRYYDAPDLQDIGKNAYRFINAVSDFATHSNPLRKTANFKENLFAKTVEGNPLIDKAYQMILAA